MIDRESSNLLIALKLCALIHAYAINENSINSIK